MRVFALLLFCLLVACGDEGATPASHSGSGTHLPDGPTDPDNPTPTEPQDPLPSDPVEPNPTDPVEPSPVDPVEPPPSAQLDSQLRQLLTEQAFTLSGLRQRNLPNINQDPIAQLGRELFFSKTLSLDNTVACASCHDPRLAGADGLSQPVGVGAYEPELVGPGRRHDGNYHVDPKANGGPNVARNSPSTFNIAFYDAALFWDGRVESIAYNGLGYVRSPQPSANGENQAIRTPDSFFFGPDPKAGQNLTEAQARFPLTSPAEMRGFGHQGIANNDEIRSEIIRRLQNNGWESAFRSAFNDSVSTQVINEERLSRALAEYQRSQVALDNDFFRYVDGNSNALTDQQKQGALLFFRGPDVGGAGCNRCHSDAHFSDENFYNLLVPQFGRGKNVHQADLGRYNLFRSAASLHQFRTPSLLNVALTAPYFHSGALTDLSEVVRWHLNPQDALNSFDFSLVQLPQFNGLGVQVPYAQENRSAMLAAFVNQQSKEAAIGKFNYPALNAADISALSAFLNSLSDHCLQQTSCVAKWLPDFSRPAPDVNRLQPFIPLDFNNSFVITVPPVGEVPAPQRNAPDLGVVPVFSASQCAHAKSAVAGEHDFHFSPWNAQESGISASRHFADQAWYNLFRSINLLINTGSVASGDLNGDCLTDLIIDAGDHLETYLNTGTGFTRADDDYGLHQEVDGTAVSLVDLNGDGWLDVFIGNMLVEQPRVYLNNGRGNLIRFTDAGFNVGRNTVAASFADIDGDGDIDAFLSHWDFVQGAEEQHVWFNDGSGYFSPAPAAYRMPGAFGERDYSFTANFSDLNKDGHTDLLLSADFLTSRLFQARGQGFADVSHKDILNDENGMGAAIGDFDNDGDNDWFISSIYDAEVMSGAEASAEGNWGTTGNRLFFNNGTDASGNIILQDVSVVAGVADGGWAWGSCAADFNNDGWLDIFQVSGYAIGEEEIRQDLRYLMPLLWMSGIHNLTDIAAFSSESRFLQAVNWLEGFDLLQKDLKDLFATAKFYVQSARLFNEFADTPARLFINQQDGSFREQAAELNIADTQQGRGIVCNDLDRDGDVDVLIVNNTGPISLYRNHQQDNGNHRHFINLRLQGKGANRAALGAQLDIYAGDLHLYREMRFENNYTSHNPAELHIGLGNNDIIEQLDIRWPDGQLQHLVNIPADQFMVVSQP
jgi:enediyne biosynthesis protein E4